MAGLFFIGRHRRAHLMGLHIFQLVTQRQHRGAEVFAAHLSSELVRLGHRVTFIALYAPGAHRLEVAGAAVYDLGVPPHTFLSWRGIRRLRQLIKQGKPDVLQANGSATLKYTWAARWGLPIPLVYRNISMISEWSGGRGWRYWFYRLLFSRVDYVTSVGEQARADFIRCYHYPPARIAVIRRGVPARPYDRGLVRNQLQQQWGFTAQDRVVMHVGSFSPEKNHLFLLDVWQHLAAEGHRYRLLLVGEGKERPHVEAEIKARGLADRVLVAGFQPIETVLPAADVLVLCSLVEGVPGVILEAATFEVPSVAVDVGGVSEVVKPGETGILLPHHDVKAFAHTLHRLLEDSSTLHRLGHQARAFATAVFDPEANARKFADLYRQLSVKKT